MGVASLQRVCNNNSMDEKTRKEEFPQLKGVTYLDHAGATLYAKSQVEASTAALTANLYGNPHSGSPSSQASTAAVDHVRDLVLRFFGTDSDSYDVVFTSGCTGALKLLSECFPWRGSPVASPPPHPPPSSNSLPQAISVPSLGIDISQSVHHSVVESRDVSRVSTEEPENSTVQSTRLSGAESEDSSNSPPRADFKDSVPILKANGEVEKSVGVENGSGEVSLSEVRAASEGRKSDGGSLVKTSVLVFYTRDLKMAGGDVCGQRRVGNASVFCYLEDNHTSVIGMREVAAQFGASVVCATAYDIVSSQFDNTAESRTPHSECGATHIGSGSILSESGAAHPESGVNQTENSPENYIDLTLSNTGSDCQQHNGLSPCDENIFNLFVYPAQSNFCGRKYPLDWSTKIPSGQLVIAGLCSPCFPTYPANSWKICLDAASFVATNPLDLTQYPADFVTVSFYKVFGFPTGLGALLVRRENAPLLHKTYYGGGTVFGTVSRSGLRVPRSDLHERLEDGTIPFLEILALKYGFQTLARLAGPMAGVAHHTFSLAKYVHDKLSAMKHANGAPVCLIYCCENFTDPSNQGGVVNFNLLRPDGKFVGYSEVSSLASVHDIHLRTGCFCNTGACMAYLHLNTSLTLQHLEAGHVCGDNMDIINGKPTGSVRISFGYMSTLEDAKTFVSFVENNFRCSTEINSDYIIVVPSQKSDGVIIKHNTSFIGQKSDDVIVKECGDVMKGGMSVKLEVEAVAVENERREEREEKWLTVGDSVTIVSNTAGGGSRTYELESIRLYPVKSCGVLEVSEWLISGCGLKYDREWVVLSEVRACLSQKQEPRLSLVLPFLNPHSKTLELQYAGKPSVKVSIVRAGVVGDSNSGKGRDFSLNSSGSVCQMRVCGDNVTGTDCGEAAASWLTDTLFRDCRLVRQTHQRTAKIPPSATGSGEAPRLSLANEAQYLLVTRASVEHLHSQITKRHAKQLLTVDDLVSRFRPNLVVSGNGMEPYEEDEWTHVTIGGQKFKVTGRCSRCRTICVDQRTGAKTSEPLQTLLQLRGSRATFGIYLTAVAFPPESD